MPTTGGTSYRSGPLETTSATSDPRRTVLPGPGLAEMTTPWGTFSLNASVTVGSSDAVRTAVTASDWVRPCTDGTVAVAPGPSRKNHAVRAAMSRAAATAGHQRRRRRPPPSATTRPSSGGGGRVMATVSDRGRVATPPAARSDAGCEPCTGNAVVEVGWAAAAAAATPAGRASRAPADRVARVRCTRARNSPASAGRSSGSRAVATATRSSSAGGRPATRLDGVGTPPCTCW